MLLSEYNQLRPVLRRELDALDKVPQSLYTDEGLGGPIKALPLRDIEDVNILYKDALVKAKKSSTAKPCYCDQTFRKANCRVS